GRTRAAPGAVVALRRRLVARDREQHRPGNQPQNRGASDHGFLSPFSVEERSSESPSSVVGSRSGRYEGQGDGLGGVVGAGAGGASRSRTVKTTRRLFARPSSVSLVSMGWSLP